MMTEKKRRNVDPQVGRIRMEIAKAHRQGRAHDGDALKPALAAAVAGSNLRKAIAAAHAACAITDTERAALAALAAVAGAR